MGVDSVTQIITTRTTEQLNIIINVFQCNIVIRCQSANQLIHFVFDYN